MSDRELAYDLDSSPTPVVKNLQLDLNQNTYSLAPRSEGLAIQTPTVSSGPSPLDNSKDVRPFSTSTRMRDGMLKARERAASRPAISGLHADPLPQEFFSNAQQLSKDSIGTPLNYVPSLFDQRQENLPTPVQAKVTYFRDEVHAIEEPRHSQEYSEVPISLAESVIEASENDVPDALKGTRQESIQSNHTLAETHRQCPEIVGDLKSFLSQPLSEELMMQCTVCRVKTDFGCLFPKFYVELSASHQPLLVAKKCIGSTRSKYGMESRAQQHRVSLPINTK